MIESMKSGKTNVTLLMEKIARKTSPDSTDALVPFMAKLCPAIHLRFLPTREYILGIGHVLGCT
jgi:hypothetical protein